jgi:peptidoglycan hydrolase-like protein with peptidoglycan-binding domain
VFTRERSGTGDNGGAHAAGTGAGRTAALIGVGAAVVAAAGVAVVLLTTSHGHAKAATGAGSAGAGQSRTLAELRVVSLSPAPGSRDVNGAAPIRLTLTAPATTGPLPRVSPAIPGRWQRDGATLVFTPQTGFGPQTHVTVIIPRRGGGVWTASYTTGTYSTLRLQQLLAQLGYLPLSWAADLGGTVTPDDTAAQLSAAYQPPVGAFTWHGGYPVTLQSFWRPGTGNLITTGAVMAFQSQHGMQPDGAASAAVWTALLHAAAAQRMNPSGYTYAVASKALPETLTIWHDGRRVFSSLANTGIGVAPTADGTYPVYIRYYFQVMQGTNPDGSHYADPVYYVAYFHGGDAVHYFPRGTYGSPQSLGCVELPYGAAAKAWPYLTYGSLVTVKPA